jgi:sarcosine oxidase gamma subunit
MPTTAALSPAAERLRGQLPPFAPLLEELEIAGWSSRRQQLSGNFHDWMLLSRERLLVTVGRAAVPKSADPIEAALVSQAAWTAVRAHAPHAPDAGAVLSLASQTLWTAPAATLSSIAVALVDTTGGNTSVAIAGDCLAWRVRAATCERLSFQQPPMGSASSFNYLSQSFPLALRERLILVADDSSQRSPKAELILSDRFSRLDAESHRRMAAADAVAAVRQIYDMADGKSVPATSIAAIRRR